MVQPGDGGYRHEWLKRVSASSLSPGPKRIAVALWTFADNTGKCYPNVEQIASRLALKSDSRVSEHLKALKSSGWIAIGTQQGNSGWNSNNYQLLIPANVGTNSPSTLKISLGPIAPEKLVNLGVELAPTDVGAADGVGELIPADAGHPLNSLEFYIVNGKDTRPPPDWAVPRNRFE